MGYGGPRRIGQPPHAVSPGRPEDGDPLLLPDRGGLSRAGDSRRGMGLSLLLSPHHHAGIARSDAPGSSPERESIGEPRVHPFPAVGIFPRLLRMHRPLCGEAGRHRGGPADLSPSPLRIPCHTAGFFIPLSQEFKGGERYMRDRMIDAVTERLQSHQPSNWIDDRFSRVIYSRADHRI
jgi:hypothetical protein